MELFANVFPAFIAIAIIYAILRGGSNNLKMLEEHENDPIGKIMKNEELTNSEKIDSIVSYYSNWGFVVQSRSDRQVQLVRPKTFSIFWLIFWTVITFGIGFMPYILYYFSRKDTIKTYTV